MLRRYTAIHAVTWPEVEDVLRRKEDAPFSLDFIQFCAECSEHFIVLL